MLHLLWKSESWNIFFKLPDKSTNAVIDDDKNYDVCECVWYMVVFSEMRERER